MIDQETLLLNSALTRFGNISKLNIFYNPNTFLSFLKIFDDNWVKYNPLKQFIPRDGLSVTSLDGGLSGIPDLGSLREFNKVHNTKYIETDFCIPTPVYNYALPYFDFIKQHIFRTHVLRLPPGGYFPIHRDNGTMLAPSTFRLLVPLKNCNPPTLFFMIGDNLQLIHWDHGHVYFVNTSLEHVLFNASASNSSYMLVINVKLNGESVQAIINNFSSK